MKKAIETAKLLNIKFSKLRECFQKLNHTKGELKLLGTDIPSAQDVKQSKSVGRIKYFAILLETILAFKGFEYLITALEINFNFENFRLLIFIPAFIFSLIFIEGTIALLNLLRKYNSKKSGDVNLRDLILGSSPLLVVPALNVAAYFSYSKLNPEGEHTIYLALAFLALLINLTVTHLLSKIIYNQEFDPEKRTKFRARKVKQKELESINSTFRAIYKVIDKSGAELKQQLHGQDISEISLPLDNEYLQLLILKYNINNKTNNFNIETDGTDFQKWFVKMNSA